MGWIPLEEGAAVPDEREEAAVGELTSKLAGGGLLSPAVTLFEFPLERSRTGSKGGWTDEEMREGEDDT